MAAQQVAIAETIRGMKLAMKRRASNSDSDDDIRQYTNRGNKLKRSAKFVQREHLNSTGCLAFKKKVNHAGYVRTTISTNPPLLDDDGDPYSPTSSDHEAERYGELAEENPFGEVRLEELLRPLTSPAELATHPSLSVPYKSKALTEMAEEALDMLRRERASLWKAKRLLQRFRGDADWVPCDTFETDADRALLDDHASMAHQSDVPSLALDQQMPELPYQNLDDPVPANDEPVKDMRDEDGTKTNREAMQGVETVDMAAAGDTGEGRTTDGETAEPPKSNREAPAAPAQDQGRVDTEEGEKEEEGATNEHAPNPAVTDLAERDEPSETASQSNGTSMHAMTTRARARSPAERRDRMPSPSPSDSVSGPAINPWFIAPQSSLIDKNLGLPSTEADETRKLLLMYVQKQEQIVRFLDTLYSGLHKADRIRHDVLRSCKAEGHLVPDGRGNMVTEMSDGEDWYDIDDWGMKPWEFKDGKLEKGKDEVEDVEEERGRRPGRGRRVQRM